MNERTDQPAGVSTDEEIRPPDDHIVTSDLPAEAADGDKAKAADAAAAAGSDGGSNGQDSATGDDNQQPENSQRKTSSRWQRTRKRLHKSEKRNRELEAENQQLKEQLKQAAASKADIPEPKLEDYKNPQEFARAFAKWEADQDEAAAASAPPKPKGTTGEQPTPDQSLESGPTDDERNDFQARGVQRLGDQFLEILDDDGDEPTPVSQTMGEFLLDSDVGPDIFVHLHHNKDAAKEIFNMPAHKAVKALEKLASKAEKNELLGDVIESEDPPKGEGADKGGKTPSSKTQTRAGEPPSDTATDGAAGTQIDPEDESMEAYGTRRKREEAEKRTGRA